MVMHCHPGPPHGQNLAGEKPREENATTQDEGKQANSYISVIILLFHEEIKSKGDRPNSLEIVHLNSPFQNLIIHNETA